jgi:ribulose 1,5-bisphosphate synthetase/thiazole synthase
LLVVHCCPPPICTRLNVFISESDVVIMGAGSAGLACAYELSQIAPDAKV